MHNKNFIEILHQIWLSAFRGMFEEMFSPWRTYQNDQVIQSDQMAGQDM